MAVDKIDTTKQHRLHDDWMTKYAQASKIISDFQSANTSNTSDKNDASNPMSMNGSIFKATSTDGAYAGTQNTNAANQNNNSNTIYDSATQQQPAGPDTVPVNGASGTTVTSSALTTPEDANNTGKQNDFTQKKEEAAKKTLEARNKYLDYLSEALAYNPDATSTSNIFDIGSTKNNDAIASTNTTPTDTAGENNPTNPKEVDANDSSDPTKTDTAYQDPDKAENKESVEKETLKKTMQDAEQKQRELERQYTRTFGEHEAAA